MNCLTCNAGDRYIYNNRCHNCGSDPTLAPNTEVTL